MDTKKTILYTILLLAISIAIVAIIYKFVPKEYHRIVRTGCYLIVAIVATIRAKKVKR